MPACVDCQWTYRGLQAILFENEQLRMTVLPELGGKIYSIIHKAANAEILWHHPRVEPRPMYIGARFDDCWSGGWDEQFPNDEPVTHDGEIYPDHGEYWSIPWDWQVEQKGPTALLYMRRTGSITATLAERWISLTESEPFFRMRLRISNIGFAPVDYIWKLHPAFTVSEYHRIDIPAGRVLIDENYRERFGGLNEYEWPFVGGVDMRRVPGETAGTTDFQYVTELQAGWLAVTNTKAHFGFGLAFPREVFSCVWLFGVYGGWRGLYTAVIEPATGYPSRLDVAAQQGTCSVLQPGQSVEAEVLGIAYSGISSVSCISSDGIVQE